MTEARKPPDALRELAATWMDGIMPAGEQRTDRYEMGVDDARQECSEQLTAALAAHAEAAPATPPCPMCKGTGRGFGYFDMDKFIPDDPASGYGEPAPPCDVCNAPREISNDGEHLCGESRAACYSLGFARGRNSAGEPAHGLREALQAVADELGDPSYGNMISAETVGKVRAALTVPVPKEGSNG